MAGGVMFKFSGKRIICIGDIMLDRFLYGQVDRISPEAPVPVVRLSRSTQMLGGVGNVARNVASLGGQATVIAQIGQDEAGKELSCLMSGIAGITNACVVREDKPTICKSRVIAVNQHVLRLDEEVDMAMSPEVEKDAIAALETHIDGADGIIISDYAKGMLSLRLVQHVIGRALTVGLPVFVDPKRDDMSYYQGATVITPNLKELRAATGSLARNDDEVIVAAREVIASANVAAVLVTRSERGMTLVQSSGDTHNAFALAKEVFDVSGAGDTVIASLALAFVSGANLRHAVDIANAAAGVVVGKLGTATVSPEELEQALAAAEGSPTEPASKFTGLESAVNFVVDWKAQGLVVGFTNGCFDILHRGHVTLLQSARRHCDRLVVAVNSDASVSRLKGPTRPINPLEDRALVLKALRSVDLVLSFEEDTPLQVIEALRPNVLFKGADYRIEDVVGGDIVRADGGEVVLLPLVAGRSTSHVIQKSQQHSEARA